ncbi:helix-turn-helix domain-containing protein [Thiohalophilus sp.]
MEIDVLNALCQYLDCQVGDLFEITD